MALRYPQRTGDQTLVREINLSLILDSLRKSAPQSRAALAELTGLNKTTVSSLVGELIEHNFVREVGLRPGNTGRPGRLLDLNPGAGYILTCEIGVDFISVLCTDFAPETIWRHRESIKPEMGQRVILDHLLAFLHQAEEEGKAARGALLGIAIGVPGLVDQATGMLLFAPNLRWKDVPLQEIVSAEFDAPVLVDNEANMAALGEHYFGVAAGYEEVLYISAGVGLGGGIVHNGRMFNGVSGTGTEFGHMTMDPEGELCNCGNRGCWETQVSQSALFRFVAEARAELPDGTPLAGRSGPPDLTVARVVEGARAGDSSALSALTKLGHNLGIGIASLVNALNPDLVVFGGVLSLASDYLLPVVEEELDKRALEWNRRASKVVRAQHGIDACAIGGVAAVYQAILADPARIRIPVN
jgi:glucokinase-like ROK family protein